MEEKRLLLALLLLIGFFFLWSWLFPPPKRAPVPVTEAPPAGEAAAAASATPGPRVSPEGRASVPGLGLLGGGADVARRPELPKGTRVAASAEERVCIDTPLYEIELTNRGARVTSWRLKDYQDDQGQPLDLIPEAAIRLDRLPLEMALEDPDASRRLREALYRVERAERSIDGRAVTEVLFAYSDGAGLSATKRLRIVHDGYLGELRVAAEAGGRPVTPYLVWGAGFAAHTGKEKGYYADVPQVVVNLGGEIRFKAQPGLKPGEPWLEAGLVNWAGVGDKYFAAVFVPRAPAAGRAVAEALPLVEEGRERTFLSFVLALPGSGEYGLFVGPKDYEVLKATGHGLDRLVDFGFFGFIALPMFYALKYLNSHVGNYGWAIIILTIGIRLVLFPFMHRSQVSMKRTQEKMKKLQPKIKALRERYRRLERKEIEKKNLSGRHRLRQKMNEEMMALYRQEGVNPLGSMSGCLPLLLQIPILYAFYKILSISIELRKAPFILWIRDLSQKDPYYITPIVMGGTMLVQQMMTSSAMPDPTQRRIMYLMPVMFTYFFINFPSGLVLYWLVSNLLSIGQQYLVNRHVEAEKRAA
ncbi:MAG: membrane protein insertase YidC [Acidobacteriota bacterium]